MDCEICGRYDADIEVLIENVKMRVCDECSELGKVVYVDRPAPITKSNPAKREKIEMELVEDYADKIINSRTKLGLTRKELADQIDEKESYLERIEKEKASPSEKTAIKLMKKLNIELYEGVGSPVNTGKKAPTTELTFGDLVIIKKKPKK